MQRRSFLQLLGAMSAACALDPAKVLASVVQAPPVVDSSLYRLIVNGTSFELIEGAVNVSQDVWDALLCRTVPKPKSARLSVRLLEQLGAPLFHMAPQLDDLVLYMPGSELRAQGWCLSQARTCETGSIDTRSAEWLLTGNAELISTPKEAL